MILLFLQWSMELLITVKMIKLKFILTISIKSLGLTDFQFRYHKILSILPFQKALKLEQ